jgi:A/G-specific adenine glycosylase
LQNNCLANLLGQQTNYPIKEKKSVVKNRYFAYFHIEVNGYIAIYQRPAGDIWQNLFDLPLLELDESKTSAFWKLELFNKNWISKNDQLVLKFQRKHILTHRRIYADFYLITLKKRPILGFKEIWVKKSEVLQYGISRLLDHYFLQQHIK